MIRSSSRFIRVWFTLGTNIAAALESLRGNWFRTALTMLGVVIGVAAVIILAAFGEGARHEITSQIDTLGSNVAIVVPGKMRGQSNFNPMAGMGLTNLREEDVQLVRGLPGVRAAAPVTFLGGGVYRGDRPAGICMPIATSPEFFQIRRVQVDTGRLFGPGDLDQQVCVLGIGLKRDLFGDEDPLGQFVQVNEASYRVIGVARERNLGSGLFGGEELDAILYLPLPAVTRQVGMTQLHRIFVDVDPARQPDAVINQVRAALMASHGNRDDFSILRARELLDMFHRIFTLLAALLLGITSISLVVGGIGIMNIMLVSVTERTREIGIRKTVGARRLDVFAQFLTEAVVLSVLGGMVGILLAVLVCQGVTHWLPLQPRITTSSVLLGFGVCVLVGVISGVAPAVSAARKDPIEAIRYE